MSGNEMSSAESAALNWRRRNVPDPHYSASAVNRIHQKIQSRSIYSFRQENRKPSSIFKGSIFDIFLARQKWWGKQDSLCIILNNKIKYIYIIILNNKFRQEEQRRSQISGCQQTRVCIRYELFIYHYIIYRQYICIIYTKLII